MALPPLQKPLLLIEDTLSLQIMYRAALEKAGHKVLAAASATEGLVAFAENRPDIVLLDLTLPDGDGITVLQDMLRSRPETSVIVITANASISKAVEAMRAGAQDFLVKPLDELRLLNAVRNAAAAMQPLPRPKAAKDHRAGLPAAPSEDDGLFIGSSAEMRRVHAKIRSVAPSMATVFITGESGTGKELCALAVHAESPRANGPFIALNCGAIPQDLLESEVFGHIKGSFTGAISDKPGAAAAADGGTLFLDEVCEMAPPLQTKLLRFLQTSTVQPVGATRPRKVNVRIVCATNRDPLEAVRRGEFREDLFYRLFVVPIHMPPLRDRGEDVIEIAKSALARFAQEEGRNFTGLSPEVIDLFRHYSWPGNVRQVLNVIRNIVVLNAGGMVYPGMLPDMFRDGLTVAFPAPDASDPGSDRGVAALVGKSMAEIERLVIVETIAHHGGSVSKAARVLELSPSTIYRKLESWGAKP